MERIHDSTLRRFVDESMGQRTALAALRRKARQMPAPTGDDRCGVGRWDSLVRNRWDRDDLGLASLFPWLSQAQSLLAQGQAAELDQLLMEVTWRQASQIAEADPFGFQAVFAYVFRVGRPGPLVLPQRGASGDPIQTNG